MVLYMLFVKCVQIWASCWPILLVYPFYDYMYVVIQTNNEILTPGVKISRPT